MAKVSIIVPVYNVENYLAMCLDSLTCQTFSDIEIICVNDGSSDESLNILEHYKKFDSRIKIINKANGGLSSARNEGMASAEGKYILFVDSDDWISSNAVEVLYNNAEKNNTDMVIFDYVRNDVILTIKQYSDKYINNVFNIETMDVFSYKLIPVSAWSKFYRTDFIKDKILFYEDMIFEDVPFWAAVYSQARRITYFPEPFYFYREGRTGSIMSSKGEKVFDVIKAYDRVESILKSSGYWNRCKYAVDMLMMLDFFSKFRTLDSSLREKFFYLVKSLHKEISYEYYKNSDLENFEKKALEIFKAWNTLSYDEFVNKFAGMRNNV